MAPLEDTSDVLSARLPEDHAHAVPGSRVATWGFAFALYVVFDGFSSGMFDVQIAPLVSLTLIATLAALALALIDRRGARLLGPAGMRTTGLILATFVLYTGLSAAIGPGEFNLSFVKNLLLFAAIVALVDSPRRLATLLLVAGTAGLVQAGLGIQQLAAEGGIPAGGLTGLLPNHVQYAAYLLLSAIALAPFVHLARGWRRLAALTAEAIMAAVIVGSLARGVLVVAVLCAVVWLLLVLKSAKQRLLATGGAVAATAVVLTVSQRLGTLLELPAALGDPARLDALLSGRLPLLLAAWNMWLANPILGVGYGRFPAVWAQYVPDGIGIPGVLRLELATHSTYLQIAAEMGIIGFGLYVALLGSGMRDAWRSRVDSARGGDVAMALVAASVLVGLIAIAAHGLLDNTGWHDRVFYILLACSVVARGLTLHVGPDGASAR